MIPPLRELEAAHAATARVAQETPLLRSAALARATGARAVHVKAESLQWTGSFKLRGAYWRLRQLAPEDAARGVVAHSSGNFAQGLAAAGAALGVPVTIVMPADAPAAKRQAAQDHGATVISTEHGDRPREEVAAERADAIAADEGLVRLHPFDDPHVVAGQAGVGMEALDQYERLGTQADIVLCCVGGGGLIAGVAAAFHHRSPETRVVAVEPEGFDGMGRSLAAGAALTVPLGAPSICDGLMARRPGAAPFAVVQAAGVAGVAVGDAAVRRAMRFAFERLKLVLEPSGAAALAALLDGAVDVDGRRVMVVATGGNVALEAFMRHVGHG